MELFFIMSEDGEHDEFVRALTGGDAVSYWRAFHRIHEGEIAVVKVPCDAGVVGVIPWATLKIDEVEL